MADPAEISSGLSLPQWMKTKPHSGASRDFDAQFASPPAHDDSFFLIRYPGTGTLLSGGAKASGPQVVQTPPPQNVTNPGGKAPAHDWSKHTQPCQQFIGGVPFGTLSKCPPTIKPKPAGTDDGFKGEGAACGSSIVRVAHKIINSRSGNSRGMSVEPIHEDTIQMTKGQDDSATSPSVMNDQLAPPAAYLNMRRGSRSLPATPLSSPPGSPGSKRKNKNVVNRFFTGPFELPPDISGSRSWILAGLLGQQREAYASTNTLDEEPQSSLAASVENLGPSPNADAAKLSQQQFSNNPESSSTKSQVYRPKPSELREMNFWSPTSM